MILSATYPTKPQEPLWQRCMEMSLPGGNDGNGGFGFEKIEAATPSLRTGDPNHNREAGG